MSMVYEHVPSLIATYLVSHKHTSYVLYHAAKRFRKPSSAILFLHILIPNLEILRYWAHYVQYGYHVSPAYLDFIVMIFHSCTSHYLVQKGHYAGHKKIVQPVFHAQMLLRLAISFCSVFLGFPSLHSATIKINAAASYPRILIWAMKRLKVLSDYKAVYTAAMFVGGLLAGHDSGIWYGPQVFIGCWAGLYVLETWAAQKVIENHRGLSFPEQSSGFKSLKSCAVLFLNKTGFINQYELQKLGKKYEEKEEGSKEDAHNQTVETEKTRSTWRIQQD